MGPYDNETQQHIYFRELMDGEWFEDEEGLLYILPVAGTIISDEGPDNATMDVLRAAWPPIRQAILDDRGLVRIPSAIRRFNPIDGYYHA